MTGAIPIVLTATVIPNGVAAASPDPEARLREYLARLEFYQRFAPVYFLENSSYPLERHSEFRESDRLRIRRFEPSANPERGKGYQEFEMLDRWLSAESQPPEQWLKISGRYQILNIPSILNDCRQNAKRGLLIDQVLRLRGARTYFFCVRTEFYLAKLRGLYQKCDDRTGAWIERVLFKELDGASKDQVRSFSAQPLLQATDGSSGRSFPAGRGQWWFKQVLRRLNRLMDKQYLWYSR